MLRTNQKLFFVNYMMKAESSCICIQQDSAICVQAIPKNSQFGVLRLLGYKVCTDDYQHHATL